MKRILTAFSMLLLLTACNGEPPAEKADATPKQAAPKTPPPPDATRSAEIIANSAEFSDYQFTRAGWSLPLSVAAMNEPARVTAGQLANAGWITMDGDTVTLAAKAQADKRFLVRANGFVDIVPLAKKEFLTVTAMNPQPDGSVGVTFTWRWVPNDITASITEGELRDRFAGDQQAVAMLLWDGSEWTVLRIAEK